MGLARTAGLAALTLAAGHARGEAQSTADWRTDFSRRSVPLEEIVSGGLPKDGIPAIDHPRFVPVAEADRWLRAREPVVALVERGEAKAYPLQILMWHEIVNDVVGGRPVAVTYCPLCNTALTFDRRMDGTALDSVRPGGFGTRTWSCTTGRRKAGGNKPPVRASSVVTPGGGSSR